MADKLLNRVPTILCLDPPADETITTLYIGDLGDTISETYLKNHLEGAAEWFSRLKAKPRDARSLVQM